MFLSNITKIGAAMMTKASSFSHANNFISALSSNSVADKIVGFFNEIVYFISKWILYVVDILFFYVQELCGLNIDTSSLKNMLDPKSDLLFRFLAANSELILGVIKRLIALGIVLVIIFSIVGIVKRQFESLNEEKPKDIFEPLKTGFRTILLMFLTPMFIIFSILASNVLLKALYQATNVSGASSLGSQIFATASISANKYRRYAANGERVPIILDFSEQEKYLKMLDSNSLNKEFMDYMNSEESPIYRACNEFGQEKFTQFDKINDMKYRGKSAVEKEVQSYYEAFDCLDHNNPYARVRAYQEEYMVMADVIDYAVKSSNTFYFKTVDEVVASLDAVGISPSQVFSDYSATAGIISFTSKYYSIDDEAEISGKTTIQYNHVVGTTDEINGAVFIIAVETKTDDGKLYLTPLKNGYKGISDYEFTSDYLLDGSIVAAKGLFDENGYPTAIKLSADRSEVHFYRDNLVAAIIGDSGDVLNNTYVEQDEGGGGLSGIIKFIRSLFNPANMLPKIEISTETIAQTYTKEATEVNRLENGKLHISYMFTDSITSKLSGHMYGININNVFAPEKLNILILVMGAVILFKVFFRSILALIKRIYDIFLLTLIYPAACATVPLYSSDNNSYKLWFETFVGKIYATYGLILGINFVLMLFPVINSIEFFSMEEIATSVVIHRFNSFFFNISIMSIGTITRLMNFIVAIIFELVAFTLLGGETNLVAELISKLVSPKQPNITNPSESPIKDVEKMVGHAAFFMGKVVPFMFGVPMRLTKIVLDPAKGKYFKKFIPGREIAESIKDKHHLNGLKKKQKEAYKDLRQSMDEIKETDPEKISKEQKDNVQKKLSAFQEAQNNYSSALKDPRNARMAAEDKKKQEKNESSASRLAGEEVDEEGNPIDSTQGISDKSNREIKKEKDEANKQKKRLKSENRSLRWKRIRHLGFISKVDKETMQRNKEQIEGLKDAIKSQKDTLRDRKETKKGIKESNKTIKRLENKQVLSIDEQKELEEAKDTKQTLIKKRDDTKAAIKKAHSDRKVAHKDAKKRARNLKKETKQRRKELKQNRAFKETSNPLAAIQRNRILKKREKELQWEQKELSKALGQDVSKMKYNEIESYISDNKGRFSPEELTRIEKISSSYNEHLSRADELIILRENALATKGRQKQADDEKFMSKHRVGFIRRGMRKLTNRSGKEKKRDDQIKGLEANEKSTNKVDLRHRSKLKSKAAVLRQQEERSRNWQANDTPEGRKQLRARRSQARKLGKAKHKADKKRAKVDKIIEEKAS